LASSSDTEPATIRFASYLLPPFHVLAVCSSSLGIERAETVEIRRLIHQPLLLPRGGRTAQRTPGQRRRTRKPRTPAALTR
jgi:hypothetical protein